MLESRFYQVVSIALELKFILQYKLMNIFSINCYFRANLKIDVAKNRIFWGISQVNSKSEIHSPDNFFLTVYQLPTSLATDCVESFLCLFSVVQDIFAEIQCLKFLKYSRTRRHRTRDISNAFHHFHFIRFALI